MWTSDGMRASSKWIDGGTAGEGQSSCGEWQNGHRVSKQVLGERTGRQTDQREGRHVRHVDE